MRWTRFAPIGLLGLACSTGPDWVSDDHGTWCELASGGYRSDPREADLVFVVDDSPSSVASRPKFREVLVESLRTFVAGHEGGADGSKDVHVVLRGASTSFERRIDYLAIDFENAWKTRGAELTDRDAFVEAFAEAFDAMPIGSDELSISTRLLDLPLILRPFTQAQLVIATNHDDGPHFVPSWDNGLRYRMEAVAVVVDHRSVGPSAPSTPERCPSVSPRKSLEPVLGRWLDARGFFAQWIPLCDERVVRVLAPPSFLPVPEYDAPPDGTTCRLLVVPPIVGPRTACDRPELGLEESASNEEMAMADVVGPDRYRAGQPVCRMIARGDCSNPGGEGLCRGARGLRPTRSATPVSGSFVRWSCSGPVCQ